MLRINIAEQRETCWSPVKMAASGGSRKLEKGFQKEVRRGSARKFSGHAHFLVRNIEFPFTKRTQTSH